MKLSLRTRGLLAFLAMIAYISVVGFVLSGERQKLLQIALSLDRLHEQEATLTKVEHTSVHAMLKQQRLLFSGDIGVSAGDDVALDIELIQSGLRQLQAYFREFDGNIAQLDRHALEMRRTPSGSALLALRDAELALDARLGELIGRTRELRKSLWETYYHVNERTTLLFLTMNLVGAIILGAVITLFFTRLVWDIRKLGLRAADVAGGYRGPPLDITRKDEIGELMEAVNRMQLELRQRERQLEFSRERHYHRERWAAVGSLAAAVAHEINNPLAAIAGIAQSMCDAENSGHRGGPWTNPGGPQLILEQTRRISAISRQIAEFTRPRLATPELIDLNRLVRNVCKFIGYDQRLHNVDVVLELDEELPAVNAVADHLTQVLMNLVINSADALEEVTDRKPTIRVATRLAGNEVVLAVADNGHGMDAATLARVFEESFSTKPAERGRGLGLFLSKTLLEQDEGRIEIESSSGSGTRVAVRLPLQPASER